MNLYPSAVDLLVALNNVAIAAVAIGFVFGFWGDPPQTIRTAAPGTGIAPDSPTTQSAGR